MERIKIKQQGGRTGRKLLDAMSDDGVGKDDGIDREREETRRKSSKKSKTTDERKSASEAKSQRISPRKGRSNELSPVRRSGRATK